MTGTDLSDLRERCIRHALTLHPTRHVTRPQGLYGSGYASDDIPPSVDVVLATAEKIFQFCLKTDQSMAPGYVVLDAGPKKRKHRRRRIAPGYGAAVRKGKRK